jgi:hypothetical protein
LHRSVHLVFRLVVCWGFSRKAGNPVENGSAYPNTALANNVVQTNQPPDGRHGVETSQREAGVVKVVLMSALLASTILTLVVFSAGWAKGSVGAGLAWLGGQHLYVRPTNGVIVGNNSPMQSIGFTNLVGTPIKILGYSGSCPCLKASGIPFELGPGQAQKIPVTAAVNANEAVRVNFMTDDAQQPFVVISVNIAKAN